MASPTTNKGYTYPAHGGGVGTWDSNLNGNFEYMDLNLGGYYPITVTSTTALVTYNASGATVASTAGTITLPTSLAENMFYNVLGTFTQNLTVNMPAAGGIYVFGNNSSGAFTTTVQPTGGSGVTPIQGAQSIIVTNSTGANFANNSNVFTTGLFGSGTEANPSITFSSDTDTGGYLKAANTIGVTCGSTTIVSISTASVTFTGTVVGSTFSGSGALLTNLPAAQGAGMVLISAKTAAASASIDFTGLDNTYDYYEICFCNVKPAADAADAITVRIGTGAGPTWQAGASSYKYASMGFTSANATLNAGGTDTRIFVTLQTLGGNAGEVALGRIWFTGPANADYPTIGFECDYYRASDNTYVAQRGGGRYDTATAFTGVRILLSNGGNIASGNFYLYGRKKA